MSATDDVPTSSSATGSRASAASGAAAASTPYQDVQRSPEFAALRQRWRAFIFLMSGVFLAWFLVYVLLSAFATGIVDARLGGTNFTVGLLLGLLQFVSTFVIATLYVRFADRNIDPVAGSLRRRVEEQL